MIVIWASVVLFFTFSSQKYVPFGSELIPTGETKWEKQGDPSPSLYSHPGFCSL